MSNIKIYGQKSGNTLIKITKEGDNIYEPIVEYISLYIKNSYVLNFSGQFNLKPMNFLNYKYFDICKLINKSKMFYKNVYNNNVF